MMIVFGTRPELIKMAPLIAEARSRSAQVELIVCSTGQHKEMLEQAMSVFGITADEELGLMQANQTLGELTARLVVAMDHVIQKHQPDIVVVHGDTTTAFVSALSAFYNSIPVAHVEAGLRTGSLNSPFPEEANRLLIARLANLHFAPTEKASKQLMLEGIEAKKIHITGNTVVDAVEMIKQKWNLLPYKGDASRLYPENKLILITTHRRENFGSGLQNICKAVRHLSRVHPELGFVFPVHLNPNVRQVVQRELSEIQNLHMMQPVDFETSLYLQSRACLILTDSGGIQEESPSFGVPCVVLRQKTERIEGVAEGFTYIAGTDTAKIIELAEQCLKSNIRNNIKYKANPYGDGQASKRIVDRIIENYSENKNL